MFYAFGRFGLRDYTENFEGCHSKYRSCERICELRPYCSSRTGDDNQSISVFTIVDSTRLEGILSGPTTHASHDPSQTSWLSREHRPRRRTCRDNHASDKAPSPRATAQSRGLYRHNRRIHAARGHSQRPHYPFRPYPKPDLMAEPRTPTVTSNTS